jgi:putative chitinase
MATLRLDMIGGEVERLQRRLRELGFNPGEIDGRFGPATEAAVLAFQRAEGLLADGIAGPRTLNALFPSPDAPTVAPDDVMPQVTPDTVSRMFPRTPVRNIGDNLPFVRDALIEGRLIDKPMVLMALATIRAETESFRPIDEGESRFNTSPSGRPFDLYDHRRDLGNQGPPDGASFRGRGFVQLTGRSNYVVFSAKVGLGEELVLKPELANDPTIAARLLVAFLGAKERAIKEALLDDDLRAARRLVNGGSHGLDRFADAYRKGDALIA